MSKQRPSMVDLLTGRPIREQTIDVRVGGELSGHPRADKESEVIVDAETVMTPAMWEAMTRPPPPSHLSAPPLALPPPPTPTPQVSMGMALGAVLGGLAAVILASPPRRPLPTHPPGFPPRGPQGPGSFPSTPEARSPRPPQYPPIPRHLAHLFPNEDPERDR